MAATPREPWWRSLQGALRRHVAVPAWHVLPAGARGRLAERCGRLGRREAWGYGMWLTAGLVIAVPELTAALDDSVPWPTISGMTGHLEARWSWVALLVVGGIVFAGYRAVTARIAPAEARAGRTPGGRPTARVADRAAREELLGFLVPVALAVVALAGLLAAEVWPGNRYLVGYVLYGSIALLWIVLPSALAYSLAWDVPFPSLFGTIADLERRLRRFHFVPGLIVAGLGILLIHLALFPWPDIIRDLQQLHGHPPSPRSP